MRKRGSRALLFREIPTPLQLLGSVLILGGVSWHATLEGTRPAGGMRYINAERHKIPKA